MCGICGVVDFGQSEPNEDAVRRMSTVMAHRGPDGNGIWSDSSATLGHTRLAVIDLTPAASQPMVSPDASLVVSFNGEIYNYRQLRDLLKARGYVFLSESDTEVILHGFREWGNSLWARLEGMFAIALWESGPKILHLVRDPLGIKPLFFSLTNTSLVFASEIKGVLASGRVEPRVNPQSLSNFLSLFYIPAPDSPIENVHAVSPATELAISSGGVRSSRYWEMTASPDHRMTQAEAQELVRQESRSAVKSSLEADVPIGLLLSGGLDSHIILDELVRTGHHDVPTTTVGFRTQNFDESEVVARTQELYGVKGETLFLEDYDVASFFDDCVWHTDSLNANFAALAEFRIFLAARQQSTVALVGSGNDELFAGYMTYIADSLHLAARRALPDPVLGQTAKLARLVPHVDRKYAPDWLAKKFAAGLTMSTAEAHFNYRSVFGPSAKQSILDPAISKSVNLDPYYVYEKHLKDVPQLELRDALLYADLQTFCIDNANVLMDGISMAFGLELRPPFLSVGYVNTAFSIPFDMKLRWTQGKMVLRRAYADRVPAHVLEGRKTGLVSPVGSLLRGDLAPLMEESLSAMDESTLLNPKPIRNAWRLHRSGERNLGLPLYLILTYLRWHTQFIKGERQ